jgi:hypothetical protein
MKEKHGLDVALDADARAVPEQEGMTVLLFEAVRELLPEIFYPGRLQRIRVYSPAAY